MPRRPWSLVPVSVALALILVGVAGAGTWLVAGLGSSEPAPLPAAVAQAAASAPLPTVRATASPARPGLDRPPALAGRAAGPPARRATPELVARLDQLLESLRVEHALPGVSATIIFADGSRWTATGGMADVKSGTPVQDETAFALASITKTFTAALVLDLAAERRLSLEESAAGRLPELGIDPRIKVRQLLDHTSGLHDYFLNPTIEKALRADPAAAWSARRALGFMSKPYFPPGRGWHYSNSNYLVLGLIAEEVTGRPLSTEIRRRYLDPLGLTTAFYQGAEEPRGPIAHAYRFLDGAADARPIDLSDGTGVVPFRAVVSASAGAGALAASSPDVARWARALYRGQATRPESLSLMLGGVMGTEGPRIAIPYGLGVQAIALDGFPTYGHAGRFIGSRGVMRWLPSRDVTVVVLTNQSRIDPGVVAEGLLAVAVPKPDLCGSCPMAS